MKDLKEIIKEFDEEYQIESIILLGKKDGIRRIKFEDVEELF
jgi:hypothetical protein